MINSANIYLENDFSFKVQTKGRIKLTEILKEKKNIVINKNIKKRKKFKSVKENINKNNI